MIPYFLFLIVLFGVIYAIRFLNMKSKLAKLELGVAEECLGGKWGLKVFVAKNEVASLSGSNGGREVRLDLISYMKPDDVFRTAYGITLYAKPHVVPHKVNMFKLISEYPLILPGFNLVADEIVGTMDLKTVPLTRQELADFLGRATEACEKVESGGYSIDHLPIN